MLHVSKKSSTRSKLNHIQKVLIATTFKTPIGPIHVTYDEHYLYRSQFIEENRSSVENALTKMIKESIEGYFENPHSAIQLPLKPQGTPFQQSIWKKLLDIPADQVETYGQVAKTIQTSARAVGQACKKNPLPLFIPCHRVVGTKNIGGYLGSGPGQSIKKFLLEHEKSLQK